MHGGPRPSLEGFSRRRALILATHALGRDGLAMPGINWTNWVGNQTCTPAQIAAPRSEEEVATLVADAVRRGLTVRVAGAGHSFTPVVATDGLLLDVRGL